jgi:lysophospholipase L1-like esterase
MSRLVALGDSYSCGEGVGVQVHRAHTWVGVLAHSLGMELDVLACPGARIGHVLHEQLPVALTAPPSVATVLAGLNDVIRLGWSDEQVRDELLATVTGLRGADAVVLLARMHDTLEPLPFPLPGRAQSLVRHRLAVINAAVDEAARAAGVEVLDLAAVPELRRRSGWAVDRLHPSIIGHRGIAASALEALAGAGISPSRPVAAPAVLPTPGQLAEIRWFARHGAPYLVRNAIKTSATVLTDRLVG